MAADLCVLDGPLLDRRGRLGLDSHGLSGLPVAWTVVGGAVAYDAADAPTPAVVRGGGPDDMCAHC